MKLSKEFKEVFCCCCCCLFVLLFFFLNAELKPGIMSEKWSEPWLSLPSWSVPLKEPCTQTLLKTERKVLILLHPTLSVHLLHFPQEGNFQNGSNSATALRAELALLEAGCTRDQQACFCLLITGVQEHELQLSTLPVLAITELLLPC